MLSRILVVVSLLAAAPAAAEDAKDTWNLADTYATPAAWEQARGRLELRFASLERFRGHLGDNAGVLAACLENMFDMQRELDRVYSYAAMSSDQDTRESKPLEMKQQAHRMYSLFQEARAFVKPEILALDNAQVDEYLAAEPRLAPYAHYLDNLLRLAPHTLDTQGEELVAATTMISDAASSLYNILANAEIPWPTVKLGGKDVRLDQSAYTLHRASSDRRERKKVFESFWGTWKKYERTMGVALYAQLKKDLFYANVRNYPTCVASALGGDNVPEAVYQQLVKSANDNLGTLHRYLKLRARMLGLSDLRYYDIYPPLVSSDKKYPIEEGKRLVLAAVAPLGEEYVNTVKKGFDSRWMDVYPRQGKRAGAYSNGSVYDVHPYVLMNYNDDYETVSTLAHEWGHTMHSYLANTNQPFATADYAIFVAEVASTFNEALLLDHVLKQVKDNDERLYYLGSALEGMRQTFFRQAMFAEFELETHTRVQKGEALSGESFTEIYGDILRRYHGHEQKIMTIDDAYAVEWAYIPHFYYNFYVYKYATSLAASSLFAKDVLDGKAGATERYLDVLEAGGSEYPYELLKNAGVDLATAAPYDALIARMNAVMDEIEGILDTSGKTPTARR